MFADPGLIVAELVEPLDQFQIAMQCERGIVADPVERRQEDAEAQAVVSHDAVLLGYRNGRKKAWISSASAAGCSIAAKCPPFFISVQRWMLV